MTEEIKTLFSAIARINNDRLAHLVDKIAGGGCASMEEYKHITGQIKGRHDLVKDINDVLKTLEKDED